ncbi:MAG: hypothetical protein HQ521_06655 [Bacteroidetes bacterium]|nr:hypothetical protein [Bacteroidota bacterium]
MQKENGWIITQKDCAVKRITVQKDIDSDVLKNSNINYIELTKDQMIAELAQSIIAHNLAIFRRIESPQAKKTTFTAEICAIDPGQRYVSRSDDEFRVNGEIFTEEELIEAVKSYFPERLV